MMDDQAVFSHGSALKTRPKTQIMYKNLCLLSKLLIPLLGQCIAIRLQSHQVDGTMMCFPDEPQKGELMQSRSHES